MALIVFQLQVKKCSIVILSGQKFLFEVMDSLGNVHLKTDSEGDDEAETSKYIISV